MWISSRTLNQIVANFERAEAKNEVLFSQVIGMTAQINELRGEKTGVERENARILSINEWMRVQINALERERAALMLKLHGVVIPVPQVLSTEADADHSQFHGEPRMTNIFDDEKQTEQEQAELILKRAGMTIPGH